MSAVDIVEKLREIASLRRGDPIPDWMLIGEDKSNWAPGMTKLLDEAREEIERLRKKVKPKPKAKR